MKRKNLAVSLPLAVLLIIIVAVLTVAVIALLPIGTGTKVIIRGQVQHEGGEDFSISYISNTQEKDEYIFNVEQPGLWFWDTQDLKVVLLINQYDEIGNVKVTSGTFWADPVDFKIIARHMEPGEYEFRMKVYALVGGFLGIGAEEVLKDTTTFNIVVEDYGN